MAKKEMIKSFSAQSGRRNYGSYREMGGRMNSVYEWTASMDYSGSFAQEWQNEEKERQ